MRLTVAARQLAYQTEYIKKQLLAKLPPEVVARETALRDIRTAITELNVRTADNLADLARRKWWFGFFTGAFLGVTFSSGDNAVQRAKVEGLKAKLREYDPDCEYSLVVLNKGND